METVSQNHNAFFEKLGDVLPEKDNGTLVNTSQCNESASLNSNDPIFRLLIKKMNAIEDFLIKISVKLDNLRRYERSNKKSCEIDISELKALGLPAESEPDIEKLEENLKDADFKQKLV